MKEQFKKTPALAVNKNGILQEVGQGIDVDQFKELLDVKATPKNGWLFLQPLSQKETSTNSGIVLVASHEFRCAVVAAGKNTNLQDEDYVRGQVVNLDVTMVPPELKEPYYINNIPILRVPQHFVICTYDGLDLSEWKAEKN